MSIFSFARDGRFSNRWCWIQLAILTFSSVTARPILADAKSWKSQQLEKIAARIQNAPSDGDRLEYLARQMWLQHWKPGQMSSVPSTSRAESALVDEPSLKELKTPSGIESRIWQRMVSIQTKLFRIDTDDDRKENLREIIVTARKLDQLMSDRLPAELQELPAPTAWALAYTRYRVGRALAYRELPSVQDQWPISNPGQYEERLMTAYQRLLDQTQRVRPEFILLEDRILRRSGQKGRALQLLESHQGVIEAKWYLKKRRDLLEELGWEPPHQEAARIYFDAGYRDDP